MMNTTTRTIESTGIPGIRIGRNNTYVIDCIKCIKGNRIHIYSSGYLNLEEAREAMPLLIQEKIEEYSNKRRQQMLFSEFYEKYENYRLLHVRLSTIHFCRSVVKKHLSSWQNLYVSQAFCLSSIEKAYAEILETKGTPAWKNRAVGSVRQMASAAFKWKIIDADSYQDAMSILENIPEHRGQKKEKEVWTSKERDAFLNAIDNEDDKTLFTLYAYLGARIGEFAGLTWDCFNPKKGTIEIKQQLIYADEGKWVLSSQLKTSESYRICKLPPKLVGMLMELKARHGESQFMFTSNGGDDPLSKAAIRRKLYQYAEKAHVRKVTPHALRHSKAMDLMKVCKNMQEVKAAARFLGHSATMMIDTYGHSENKATEAVIKRLEKDME